MATVCRTCAAAGPFYECFLNQHNHICIPCAQQAVQLYRKQDPATLLAFRWYNALRGRGIKGKRLKETARRIYERCGGKSVISGNDNVDELCIVHVRDDVSELDESNCVLVTAREARSLSHIQKGRLEKFPPEWTHQ